MSLQTRQARASVFAGADESEIELGPPQREEVSRHHLIDEHRLVGGLIERAVYSEDERRRTAAVARRLVSESRTASGHSKTGIDAFMREYGLSTDEGVILLCLAEALLRIPDQETADAFLADKLSGGDWRRHLGSSDSLFVNASTWGLMLSGRVLKFRPGIGESPPAALASLVARSGEPVVRKAVRKAVDLLSQQFVMGRDIGAAIARARDYQADGYRLSYDMLGEEALSEGDAQKYFDRYMSALEKIGDEAGPFTLAFSDALLARPSVSIKLSALHAKFAPGFEGQLHDELVPRLVELARAARAFGLALTFDAEEQDRLDGTLEMFAAVFADPELAHWNGLGIAVQAYSKRAIPVLRWLRKLALHHGKRIPVRLVKGAYWDNEIKWAQDQGLADYPVFTRKLHTDVSFLACMRFLFSYPDAFYPQIATHNAYNIASAMTAAGNVEFEYQRLHGMGEGIFRSLVGSEGTGRACRIYAPVGAHDVLLSYLVRRLLENGANTSFVNRLADRDLPISDMVEDPVVRLESERAEQAPVKMLVKPRDVFWPERKNAAGLSFADPVTRAGLSAELERAQAGELEIGPLIAGHEPGDDLRESWMLCPHDRDQRLGVAKSASHDEIEAALAAAHAGWSNWERRDATERGKILQLAGDLFERDRSVLMAALVRESGHTIDAAQREVRRAIDFLRYYAGETRKLFHEPRALRSPTGETNSTRWRGLGPMVAVSSFNSPLALFTGQIAAGLGAGNTVIAKPAPQTPLSAYLATRLLHEAGVPEDALHLLPGGDRIVTALCKDERVKCVALTGRNKTAWAVRKLLADRRDAHVRFIGATSTLNVMIADSSALAERLVSDVVQSAFAFSGQSCTAARVLFVQDDSAARVIDLLAGAVEGLTVGDPMSFATEIGPVIDHAAQDDADAHKLKLKHKCRELIDRSLAPELRSGTFVAPAVFEFSSLDDLSGEVLAPILHVVRYERGALGRVVEDINASGMTASVGVHSRIDGVAKFIETHVRAGNVYVNRQQCDAVPGVQPFGSAGQTGTGPAAGGPNYVLAFAGERTRTDNSAAAGGNIRLLAHDLSDPD